MAIEERLLMQFGQNDFIFLDWQEKETFMTIIRALQYNHEKGRKKYSMMRLLNTAFKLRNHEFITFNKLRRIIVYMLASRPRLLHIRQSGNYRLVSPSDETIKLFSSKSPKYTSDTPGEL